MLVAAPGVVKRGAVAQPEDLASSSSLPTARSEPLQWHFTKSDFERKAVRMNETLTINPTTPAVLAATLAGAGLAVLPISWPWKTSGWPPRTNMPAWTLPAGGIHAVYPAARFRPPKVTTFVAMLVEEHKRMAQTKMKRQSVFGLRSPRRIVSRFGTV